MLNKAIALHQQGDKINAEILYLKCLASEDKRETHYLLGLLYSQLKYYDKSISHLEKAISQHCNNADIFNALAICYQEKCLFKTALRLITIAVKLKPDNPLFLNRKCKILLDLGQLSEAQQQISACVTSFPDFIPGYITLSNCLNSLNQPYNSVRVLITALRKDRANHLLLFNLASNLIKVSRFKAASNILYALLQNNLMVFECHIQFYMTTCHMSSVLLSLSKIS